MVKMKQPTKEQRRRAARIKYELALRGLSLAALDRRHKLRPTSCAHALYEPHEAAERAIAKAIGQPPQSIWPERFDALGVRLQPQPARNFRPRAVRESRHKVWAGEN